MFAAATSIRLCFLPCDAQFKLLRVPIVAHFKLVVNAPVAVHAVILGAQLISHPLSQVAHIPHSSDTPYSRRDSKHLHKMHENFPLMDIILSTF